MLELDTDSMKFLGYVGVDSGQIMLVDPCYVEDGLDYDELIKAPTNYAFAKSWQGGVVTPTSVGDGAFSAYAFMRGHDILGIFIDIDGLLIADDEDDEDEDED